MAYAQVIKPKTDPAVVMRNGKNFIEELSKTPEYQEAKEWHESSLNHEVKSYVSGTIGGAVFVVTMFITGVLPFKNDVLRATYLCGGVLITLVCMVSCLVHITLGKIYARKSAEYEESIKPKTKTYKLHNIFFNEICVFNISAFSKSDTLKLIDKVRELQKPDEYAGCTYELLREDDLHYIERGKRYDFCQIVTAKELHELGDDKPVIYICQCLDGIVKSSIRLGYFDYDVKDMDVALASPGVLDLSFLDARFWGRETPYYEKEAEDGSN